MCTIAAIVSATASSQAGSNANHEIQVYSVLEHGYGDLIDAATNESDPWKSQAPQTNAQDPYHDFWDEMSCSGVECMRDDLDTARRENSEVSVNNMASSSVGWDEADMVVFHGHIAHIKPLWSLPAVASSESTFWRPYPEGGWSKGPGEFADWGTSAEPYRYHRYTITDASLSNPFIVFYAHNPLTSLLIGKDYVNEVWYTENAYNQVIVTARGPHRLGDSDLEWIVANGCSAVPVAMPQGSSVVATPLGTRAWRKSWSRLHQVLGHYYLSVASELPDLGAFAADIKAGDTIRQAYFDLHTHQNPDQPAWDQPSSIAATPPGCCSWNGDSIVCMPNMCYAEYQNETWLTTLPDPEASSDDDSPPLITSWKVGY
jgi:hypothetical protein